MYRVKQCAMLIEENNRKATPSRSIMCNSGGASTTVDTCIGDSGGLVCVSGHIEKMHFPLLLLQLNICLLFFTDKNTAGKITVTTGVSYG